MPFSADGSVSVSEVISAMTFALDLTEAAQPGHALRCCLMGMRLAEGMGVSEEMRTSLYYALQLKDVGCSNNSARMTSIVGGDDRSAKAIAKMCDWTRPHRVERRTIKLLWGQVMPGKSLPRRALRFAKIGLTQHKNNKVMIDLRCDRGAEIVTMLELGPVAAQAVRSLDEHWDGKGYPDGLHGDAIPLLARICSVAQNLDIFAENGQDAAMNILRERSGKWFDPAIVRAAEKLHAEGTLWENARREDDVEKTRAAVMALDPGTESRAEEEWVDTICKAFAEVVDAKSPFTYRHSVRVAAVAVELAKELGMSPDRVQLLRRAALLHDLGKLAVSNLILDKKSELTNAEWDAVLLHPGLSREILERVPAFREVARLAGEHHEKLDGSGYPQGLNAENISMESRLLVLADCYTALAEHRPYRGAVEAQAILAELEKSVPHKLDATCFAALQRVVGKRAGGKQ